MTASPIAALAKDLDADLARWVAEVSGAELRSTLGFGILFQVTERTESLLRHGVGILQAAAPKPTTEALKKAAPHKPLEMLTFGQTVKVIEQVAKRTRLLGGQSLAVLPELKLLDRLSRLRSDFAHGRFHPLIGHANVGIEAFLSEVRSLCASTLVEHLALLESGAAALSIRVQGGGAPAANAPEVVEMQAHQESVKAPAVVSGRRYTYTEDEDKFEVLVVGDLSTAEFHIYQIEVTKVMRGDRGHAGKSYTISMKRGVRFKGMWKLHPLEN